MGLAEHKRQRKSGSPTRRLFAVGEDSSLAAVRSALRQFSEGCAGRLEYWTAEPASLVTVAAELARSVPPHVMLEAVVQASAVADAQKRSSLRRLLEAELSPSRLVEMEFTAAAFARRVRRVLEAWRPVRLLLPAVSDVQELRLLATPAVLLPGQGFEGGELRVVCRVTGIISAELMYGTPLLLAPDDALGAGGACFEELASGLRHRQESLMLTAGLDPLSLKPAAARQYFVLSADTGAVTVCGLVTSDVYCPGAVLVPSTVEEGTCDSWPSFDPFELRRERKSVPEPLTQCMDTGGRLSDWRRSW